MRYFHFIAPDVSFNKELQTRQCAFTKTKRSSMQKQSSNGLTILLDTPKIRATFINYA